MTSPSRGFLTFALGEKYLRLAYAQALSIKGSQNQNAYAVITDWDTAKQAPKHYADVMQIISLAPGYHAPMALEHLAYSMTPFVQTIKLDADMLLLTSMDHLWPLLSKHDMVICTNVKDFRGNDIKSRVHRKKFDDNLLPDVYSALTFFQKSKTASEFYYYAERLTNVWNELGLGELQTDELYALSARIVGVDKVTLPTPLLSFVHGKSELWGLRNTPWPEQLYTQWDRNKLLIGHHYQTLPFHYHYKEWMKDDTIEHLELVAQYRGPRDYAQS